MPVGAQRSCGRSPLSLQLSPPPRVLASFGNVCEKHTEGAGLERWREAPCGERGGCCEEGSQRRRAVEESRAFARGLQPGVKLGNCALMTWRSPLGFPETHFCLLSPESPRSVPRGPVGTAGGEAGFYCGESQCRWGTKPTLDGLTTRLSQHHAAARCCLRIHRHVTPGKHGTAPILSPETTPQPSVAPGVKIRPRKPKVTASIPR